MIIQKRERVKIFVLYFPTYSMTGNIKEIKRSPALANLLKISQTDDLPFSLAFNINLYVEIIEGAWVNKLPIIHETKRKRKKEKHLIAFSLQKDYL